jgi:MATE family multidrug resistance protein
MTVIAGRIGANEVAAYQILLNMLAVVFMVAMGLAAATAVLVSEAKGAKNAARMAAAGWMGLGINTAFMVGLGLLVVLAAPLIGRAFTADAAVAAIVATQIVLGALIMAPDGGQVVAAAALRARGDNWFPTASHVLAYVIVMPPLALWLAEGLGMGVSGLMWAIFWASVLSVAVLIWRFWRLAKR